MTNKKKCVPSPLPQSLRPLQSKLHCAPTAFSKNHRQWHSSDLQTVKAFETDVVLNCEKCTNAAVDFF